MKAVDLLPPELREEFRRHEDAVHAMVVKYPQYAKRVSCIRLGYALAMADHFGLLKEKGIEIIEGLIVEGARGQS